jgi:DDE superfamily endonuclease
MDFPEGLLALALPDVVGIQPPSSVGPPGMGPLPPRPWSGRGRPPTRRRRAAGHAPVAAESLARSLPATAWRTVGWREGSRGELASRFAACRVRPGHRDHDRREPLARAVALDRVARGRGRADQVLAREPAGRDAADPAGRAGQAARADRARRSGAEAGAWARALRGPVGSGAPDGAGFITTLPWASRLTAFSSWSGCVFPLQAAAPVDAQRLAYPKVSARAAPGQRRQRHVPHSIASLRHRPAVPLARQLDLCPCCERRSRTAMAALMTQ